MRRVDYAVARIVLTTNSTFSRIRLARLEAMTAPRTERSTG